MPGTTLTPIVDRPRYLEWGPVIAGALAATAISFLFLTFGTAVGLSVTSPWPGRGVSLSVAAWAVIWWTVLVQIGAFAAGGYLAGRMRSRWGDSASEEGQFRDSAHGFLVWALGVIFGAVLLAITGSAAVKATAQAASGVAAGAAASAAQMVTVAPTDYAVDLLLRPAPSAAASQQGRTASPGAEPLAQAPAPHNGDGTALRAEATRIFLASIKNQQFTAGDRDYLTQVVMRRTGLSQNEAQQRVDQAMNTARDLEIKARDTADKARKATVIAGFIAAASLLISSAAATTAANLGGRHRDDATAPVFFGHHQFW